MFKRLFECSDCGNKIVVDLKEELPEKCPYCEESEEARKKLDRKKIIELIQRKCIPNYTDEICHNFYTKNSLEGCIECWITWAEEQIKNGT